MNDAQCLLVVTPTLGESPFLDRTVASIEAQPLHVRHVISTTARKVPELAARYPHATVVPDAGRLGGIYGAINSGLEAAKERFDWDWFTYINDDDLLLPGFGRVMLENFRDRAPAPVSYGDVELVDEHGTRISCITTAENPGWIPALLHQGISPLMQQGMAFRRDVVARLGGFDLRYRLCADLDFWLRAFAAGERFRYHPERVAQFRLRDGQLSSDTSVTRFEQDSIVARHLPRRPRATERFCTRVLYRAYNFPRYVERFRTRGFRTSYALLQQGSAAKAAA
jgi:GT2 family glycosyltransferase